MNNRVPTTPVSVIIVCFNNAAFIAAAVKSVQAQALSPREIIVVDNGSGDGSIDILRGLASQDSRMTLAVLESNCGPGIARNHGLTLATTDYVMFLDGDDLLEPDALATAYAAATAMDSDLVQFGYRRCNETGEAESAAPCAAEATGDSRRDMLKASPAVWTRLYRRDLLERVAEPFRSGIYEDIAWSARHILESQNPVIIPGMLVRHRVYRHSTIKARHSAHTDFADAIACLVGGMRESLPAGWDRNEIGAIAILRIRKFLPNVLLRTGAKDWLEITYRLNHVIRNLDEAELSGVCMLLSGRPNWGARVGRFLFWNDHGVRALARSGLKLVHAASDNSRMPGTRHDLAGRPHL